MKGGTVEQSGLQYSSIFLHISTYKNIIIVQNIVKYCLYHVIINYCLEFLLGGQRSDHNFESRSIQVGSPNSRNDKSMLSCCENCTEVYQLEGRGFMLLYVYQQTFNGGLWHRFSSAQPQMGDSFMTSARSRSNSDAAHCRGKSYSESLVMLPFLAYSGT